ncbi:MAG: metalloregulator ArsR/SmtB family transcription factor [Pelolinea sp.]|nr:metalloregulator ArsR/SmtB family transcription factor [Pelolinea sp.]
MNIPSNLKNNYRKSASLLRVISHPVRMAILDILLSNEEECVCHMEAILGCRQAYLSQHLMTLREAGIVTDRRDGRNVFYRVENNDYKKLIFAVKNITGQNNQSIFFEALECNCPKCVRKIIQENPE